MVVQIFSQSMVAWISCVLWWQKFLSFYGGMNFTCSMVAKMSLILWWHEFLVFYGGTNFSCSMVAWISRLLCWHKFLPFYGGMNFSSFYDGINLSCSMVAVRDCFDGVHFIPGGNGPLPEVLQYRANPWQRRSKPLTLRQVPKISLIS